MPLIRRLLPSAGALLLAATLGFASKPAGATVVTTPFNANNALSGEVFQIHAFTDLIVNDFGLNLIGGDVTTFTIYEHDGAFAAATAGSAVWTQIFSGGPLTSNGPGAATQLNAALNFEVPAGSTDSFLVVVTPNSVGYTNGGSVGAELAANTEIQILQGWGETTSFTTVTNRQANVDVLYSDVPEPGSLGLFGLGLCGLVAARPRRKT